MLYRTACFVNYIKYVSYGFDQLNDRYSYLTAAAVGSMQGSAYFPLPMGRPPVVGTHVNIGFLVYLFHCLVTTSFVFPCDYDGMNSRDELCVFADDVGHIYPM